MNAADYVAVSRTVAKLGLMVDHREWDDLVDIFAPEVTVDYTSLWGGNVVIQSGSDLVEGWRNFLPNTFHSTVHLIGNPDICFSPENPNVATVHAPVTAWHNYSEGVQQESEQWVVSGHYQILLENHRSYWRITKLVLETRWQKGKRPQ